MKTLTIRVSDEEHKLMQAVAARRFMTITGITRAHFNAHFVADGLMLDQAEEARRALESQAKAALAPKKPVIERRPYPPYQPHVVVAERANKGESLADIAESYGISLDRVKDMNKRGKEWLANERDTNELLAYAEKGSTTPPPVQEPARGPEYDYSSLANLFDDEPEPSTTQPKSQSPEPELVYDPVDPDNPTEEEQATSAEIARRKLVAFADHMGLNL